MRVEILGVEMTIPNKLLDKLDFMDMEKLTDDEKELISAINKLVTKGKILNYNSNKSVNIQKATNAKINKTKEKIQNAINLLRLQGEEINPYRIAKVAHVSYNTARKYFSLLLEKN